jgi:nucleotide-binding universal stress UspA family protein
MGVAAPSSRSRLATGSQHQDLSNQEDDSMTDLKMILAATDFSRSATIAVRRAVEIALATGARLELMHVAPPKSVTTRWTTIRGALGFDSLDMREDSLERLRQAAERITAQHALPVETHLAEGKAHVEIAARAAAITADMVVVGAHGEHLVLDVLIGTTAQRVQRLATVPVLLVRQAPFNRYERVLFATDFSPASAAAAQATVRFFPEASLHVLHAFDALFESRLALDDAAIEDYRRQTGDEASRELESFVSEAGLEGRIASLRVRHGYAPTRIKERAAELDADLIVLGTQGKSWLAIGFLGSVSEHVAAESSSDILLVRPPA